MIRRKPTEIDVFSTKKPISITKSYIESVDLSEVIELFLEENFDGAVETKIVNEGSASLFLSLEFIAYFFRLMLMTAYGKALVKIKMTSTNKGIVINIHAIGEDPEILIAEKELVRVARNAGFEYYLENGGIELVASHTTRVMRNIYAIPPRSAKFTLLQKFYELFTPER